MNMKRYLTVLMILFAINIYPQKELSFEFDYAQFQYDSTSNYLEIYYSIFPADLKVSKQDGSSLVKAKMHIQIQNINTDELVVNKDWSLSQPINDSVELKNDKTLLGIVGFYVKTGNYVLDINIEDVFNSNNKKSYSERIDIIPFSSKIFGISDIELATRIVNDNANKNSIFYKNTLEVYPNPSIVYSEISPVLFYYTEIYNLNKATHKVSLTKKIFNSKNSLVYENSKTMNSTRESIVEVGTINLSKYPTDTYTLMLKISEDGTDKYVASSKKFFLVNPKITAAPENLAKSNYISSEFGVLQQEECDDLFQKSKVLASSSEKDGYKKLDSLNLKREFLYNFWKRRDPTPETEENEFKKVFLERVEIANARYSTMNTPGYKTDRGRVFLQYGDPDEVERFPNETNTKPYETWTYKSIEGGVIFVFADLMGFNYYELLHSTKRGELQDPNWMNRISAN
jgi:GWxTD domain-containing protein